MVQVIHYPLPTTPAFFIASPLCTITCHHQSTIALHCYHLCSPIQVGVTLHASCYVDTPRALWAVYRTNFALLHLLLSTTANGTTRRIGERHTQELRIETRLTVMTHSVRGIHKCNDQRRRPMGWGRLRPDTWNQHQPKRQLMWVWGIHTRMSAFSLRERFG